MHRLIAETATLINHGFFTCGLRFLWTWLQILCDVLWDVTSCSQTSAYSSIHSAFGMTLHGATFSLLCLSRLPSATSGSLRGITFSLLLALWRVSDSFTLFITSAPALSALVPVLLLTLFVPRFPWSTYSHILTKEVACSSETSVDVYHITLRHTSEDSNSNGSISFLSRISVRQLFESSVGVNYDTPCSLAVHRLTHTNVW
jgi:hypothetical protein